MKRRKPMPFTSSDASHSKNDTVLNYFRRLIEPHPSLKDPIRRRVVSMVAAFHLLTAPIAPTLHLTFDEFLQPSMVLLIFLIGLFDYGLVRSKWFFIGIWTPIVMIAVIFIYFVNTFPPTEHHAFILLVGFLLAGVLLSLREMLAVAIMYCIVFLSTMMLSSSSQQPFPIGALALCCIISGLVFMLRIHRTWVEELRKKEIQEHLDRQVSLLSLAFDGIAITQNDSFIKVTQGFASLFEKDHFDIINKKVQDILPHKMLGPLTEHEKLQTTTFLASDGALRFIQFVREERPANKEWIYAVRDITKQQLQRAELQLTDRMISAGVVAAGVAHEVNTPLMVIMAEMNFLNRHSNEILPSLQKRLDHIESSVDRIAGIMDDLKRFTRPNECKTTLDVNNLVESTLRLAQHSIGPRCNIKLELGVSPQAAISEGKLSQVVLNLLLNAAQSRKPSSEFCQLLIKTTQSTAERVIIDIIDDGIGIPLDNQNIIFEPFFTTKKKEGTGLGLSICQRILSAHHGHIALISSSEKGSHFQVSIPPSTKQEQIKEKLIWSETTVRGNILLIDDNPAILELLSEMLEPHVVTPCSSVEEGILILQSSHPDLILCDLVLPGDDGTKLYDYIAQHMIMYKQRLIFITGGAVDSSTQDFIQEINRPVLFKPFQREKLLFTIHQELERINAQPLETAEAISLSS